MLKVKELENIKGFLRSHGELGDEFLKITSDNRDIMDHNTFAAIVGERYNPLSDLEKLRGKIKYIICESTSFTQDLLNDDFVFVEVKNLIEFLQDIGKSIAVNFQKENILIAVAGSNGKTTTKEMLSHALKFCGQSYISTQKNHNNHLGVPLTLFQIRPETKFAVIELGSNHPGEMEVLNQICGPRYGLVTNIGHTHLEFFNGLEEVFKEEANIFEHIKNNKASKIFFKNADDEFLKQLEGEFVIDFGENAKNYKFSYKNLTMNVSDEKAGKEYQITNEYITGEHNFFNLAVTFVILKELSTIAAEKLIEALASFKPTPNRGEWINYQGKKIFLDAYNANPSSMLASIKGFLEKAEGDKNLIILGDMNELGESSDQLHFELGKKLKELKIKNVRFIGARKESYLRGHDSGQGYKDAEQYKEQAFLEDLQFFNYFLIKGSRSLQLESILDIK